MNMPYTINENLPRIRADAVRMVRRGASTRKVARHFGYSQSAVAKWCKKADIVVGRRIETQSSRPHHHPRSLSKEIVARVIATRMEYKRCSEVTHEYLKREGTTVSLSSVKRILGRYRLLKKRSKWKRFRRYPPRPDVLQPGDLVEFDTVHLGRPGHKKYVYTALDVYSRYGFAMTSDDVNCRMSVRFLKQVFKEFPCRVVQTDNGSEFGLFFSDAVKRVGAYHRHIHPRSPNENGHLERFNRTIQEEPLALGLDLSSTGVAKYLTHYNEKRLHMGLKFKTPKDMLQVIPRS